jgi:hypothetical protein
MRTSLFRQSHSLHPLKGPFLLMVLLVILAPVAVQANDEVEASQTITVKILDANGSLVTGGSLLFKGSDQREIEFKVTEKGSIGFSETDFPSHEIYRVAYEDTIGQTVFLMDSWTFDSEEYELEYNTKQKVNKYQISPVFQDTGVAHPNEIPMTVMTYQVNRVQNPWWYETTTISTPKFLLAAQASTMFGSNWTTNSDALKGVVGQSLGFNFVGAYRFGYPDDQSVGKPVISFRELSVAYAFHGYEVNQALEPGQTADLTFHRVTAAFSFGRMSNSLNRHYCFGPAISVGGILDGSNVLEYMNRTYRMVGFGAQGKYIIKVVHMLGIDLGLQGQLEIMYYPADNIENDFWYGLAPSFSLGATIY